MSKQRPKRLFTVEEAVRLLQEAAGSVVCPDDSSSDEEDPVHPDNTQDETKTAVFGFIEHRK